jgi:hypothetical protein
MPERVEACPVRDFRPPYGIAQPLLQMRFRGRGWRLFALESKPRDDGIPPDCCALPESSWLSPLAQSKVIAL